MTSPQHSQFIAALQKSLSDNTFIKLTFANKRNKSDDLKTASAKRINIKQGEFLSVVYRHETKDITKNYSYPEAGELCTSLLNESFHQGDLYTTENDYHYIIHPNGKSKLRIKAASSSSVPADTHDKTKQRIINTQNNIYLRELGITTGEWKVRPKKQDKYRQINKYIEIIDGILKSAGLENEIQVADMGAGKGYLTFALYDYLNHVLHKKAKVTGIELRKELVDECNRIAALAGFSDLSFQQGTIKDVDIPQTDVMIALHACDTATDDAIFRGIAGKSKVIICAPCCHKQIRKQINPNNALQQITQYGILKERQSELITDGIRALLLEAHGYKTKVFEFISTEHTPKNILIVGIKTEDEAILKQEKLQMIASIKQTYGIQYHYLEKLLGINDSPDKL